MTDLKNVVYISNADYETLITNGSVTVNGITITHDSNDLYITPEEDLNIISATGARKIYNSSSPVSVSIDDLCGIATASTAGLVKSSTTGTVSDRNYNVEVNSDGTMKVNVPWTYTDTKNTAGAMNDAGKLYLVGAKTQDANPQTYSYSQVYMTDGTLAAPALSTRNIVLPESNLGLKFIDGDNVASAANFHYSSIGGASLNMNGHLLLNEAGGHPNKPDNKTGLTSVNYADYFDTGITVSGTASESGQWYKLSFPGKTGTIALTSDLSTLLDKGTENSSMVTDQVIYNPVEMQKRLTLPSVGGRKIHIDGISGNEAPLFLLKGAASGNDHISALILNSLPIGATDISTLSATKIEQRAGSFTIQHRKYKTETDSRLSPVFGFNEDHGWNIDNATILTANDISTQQWKLTSTTGTVTTVNICTK